MQRTMKNAMLALAKEPYVFVAKATADKLITDGLVKSVALDALRLPPGVPVSLTARGRGWLENHGADLPEPEDETTDDD